jgi:hypothetical protein
MTKPENGIIICREKKNPKSQKPNSKFATKEHKERERIFLIIAFCCGKSEIRNPKSEITERRCDGRKHFLAGAR